MLVRGGHGLHHTALWARQQPYFQRCVRGQCPCLEQDAPRDLFS